MTDIALTVKEVFPHSRLVDFFNQGKMEAAANKIFRWLGGKTYEEWFEYFQANDFKPKNWREAPVFAKIMAILYQGMVLEAENAAHSWLVLSENKREEYKREALALAKRKRFSWSFQEALELAFYSFLVFHNFFRDFDLMEESLDKFVAIIFEAVVSEQEISNIAYKRDKEIIPSTQIIQPLVAAGLVTSPPHRDDVESVSEEARRELAQRLGQCPGKPLSEIIIEERGPI